MPGHPLDWLRSVLRRRCSSRSFPALPGLKHSEGLEENILGFLLKQVRRAVIVLNRPAWRPPSLCRGRNGYISQSGFISNNPPRATITIPLTNFSERPARSCNFLRLSVTTAIMTMRLSSKM